MKQDNHLRSQSALETSQINLGFNEQNLFVSVRSKFNDDVWNFEHEIASPTQSKCHKVIRWDFKVKGEERFTDAKYFDFLLACKQLLHAMMWHPEQNRRSKPASLIVTWEAIRGFVTYLIRRPFPIHRLSDVTPSIIDEYKKKLRSFNDAGRTIEISTLYMHYRELRRLFQYRFKLHDTFQFDPFDGTSPAREAGYTRSHLQQCRTDFIPDSILSPLISTALTYVNQYSDHLLKAADQIQEIRKAYPHKQDQPRLSYKAKKVLTILEKKVSPAIGGDNRHSIRAAFSNLRQLQTHLIRLRTSCFILIAFITGMRISEILSLKEGCIEAEQTKDGDFIWLWSILHKTQDQLEGTPTKWLGGPVVAKAAYVLERLTDHIRSSSECRFLFLPVTKVGERNWNGSTLSSAVIAPDLFRYCKWLGLKNDSGDVFHLHPHMFRRTFARHVVRCDSTNLLALKEHFKHWSVAMTDGYVGADEELQELLTSEAERLSFETFDKVMSAHRLGGGRGREITLQIDKAIDDGRLAVEFRGEAGTHLRHALIKEMMEAGQEIYVCGSGNYCWFRKDSAMCSKGDFPVIEICNPVGCTNSVIHEEHRPHWEELETATEELLRLNPKGEPYRKRLINFKNIVSKVLGDL